MNQNSLMDSGSDPNANPNNPPAPPNFPGQQQKESSYVRDDEIFQDLPSDISSGSKAKWWLLILFIIIVGLGVFYYFFFPPKIALYLMSRRLEKINTYSYSGEMDINVASGKNIPLFTKLPPDFNKAVLGIESNSPDQVTVESADFSGSLMMKFQGQADASELANPKLTFAIDSFKLASQSITVDVFSLETRFLNDIFYLKINDISPELLDATPFKNIWYQQDTKEAFGREEPQNQLSQEDQTKIRQLLKKYQVFHITKKINDEKIGKTFTNHYQYEINKDEMINYLVEAAKIQNKTITDQEAENTKQEMQRYYQDIESIGGEIWLGKFDFYPHKVSFKMNLNDGLNPFRGEFKAIVNLENINKDQNIEAPPEAQEIEKLSALITEQIMKKYMPQVSEDQNRDSDGDGSSDMEESIFGTNPNNPDTDNDGYSDGDEVKNGYNPNGPGQL